jgi:predicted DNA-binding protein YlxM (UPF0122 family)
MQWTTMPLKCLVYHLLITTVSKNILIFHLNTKVKEIEESEKDKLSMKEIVTKFTVGKTQVYDVLKAKMEVRNQW